MAFRLAIHGLLACERRHVRNDDGCWRVLFLFSKCFSWFLFHLSARVVNIWLAESYGLTDDMGVCQEQSFACQRVSACFSV